MKYSIQYFLKFPYYDEVDEINILFRADSHIDNLLPFLEKYQEKQINIFIQDSKTFLEKEELVIVEGIIHQHPRFHISLVLDTLVNEDTKELFEKIKSSSEKIPYFFQERITNYDLLWSYISAGVTDIYVAEQLGFELPDVAKVAHNCNTKVRVYPNIAQSATPYTPPLFRFFIRPEDVEYYSQYIDTLEFYGNNEHKLITTFDIYVHKKKWQNDLGILILDLGRGVADGRVIDLTYKKIFPSRRSECGRRCLKNRRCHFCSSIESATKKFQAAIASVEENEKI